jgi:ABC-type antimicrobial peptide transport system permease subunit
MAYTVAQRNREIGIRMALGASRPAIRRLVMWSGMRLALAGMAVGALAAFALTRLMASFLFDVRPWDPVAFVSAPLILGVVALVAVWVPGIRASRIDPVEALRTE